MRKIHPLLLSIPFIATMSWVGACSPPPIISHSEEVTPLAERPLEASTVDAPAEPSLEDIPYRHPLQDAVVDGKVILHDIKGPTPTTRYAVGNTTTIYEEGAPAEQTSGVFVLERGAPTDEQRAQVEEQRQARQRLIAQNPRQVLADDLQEWSALEPPTATREVNVGLLRPEDYTPLITRLERAIALGLVKTYADKERVRSQLMAEQRALVKREQDHLIAALELDGGLVKGRCSTSFCISLEVTPSLLERLTQDPRVRRIDAVHPLVNEELRGREVEAGTQLSQFVDIGHDGLLNTGIRLKIGVIEHQQFNIYHPAFLSTSGSGSTRVSSKRECDGGTCLNVADYGTLTPLTSNHATLVAGVAAGDLMDGQDPSGPVGTDDRRDRSGYAREANIYLWRTPDDWDIDEGLSDIANFDLPVLNMSITDDGDITCQGNTTLSGITNDLFDAGTVVFKAAGNDTHTSTTDCKVSDPGSAIGAFTVGGHTNDEDNDNEADVRDGQVFTDSSRGGTSTEGLRTIVDITAAACPMVRSVSRGKTPELT